jgi:hypothetical protein
MVRQSLAKWQIDPDLAGVREPDALAKWSPDEQKSWTRFWSDVAAQLRRAQDQQPRP